MYIALASRGGCPVVGDGGAQPGCEAGCKLTRFASGRWWRALLSHTIFS